MNTEKSLSSFNLHPFILFDVFLSVFICGFLLTLAGCRPTTAPIPPTATAGPPAPTATPAPTLSLDQTSAGELMPSDFKALHLPVPGDENKFLILGNLAAAEPAPGTPPGLVALRGRWEGYNYAPPVKKDIKLVMVIQQIDAREGKLSGWSGTNLQFPDRTGTVHFRVLSADPPTLEFQIRWPGGPTEVDQYTYDREKDMLVGWAQLSGDPVRIGPIELTRARDFYVYKDYAKYLAGKGITAQAYRNAALSRYGAGYLLYLPEGYAAQPRQSWPLILFLHGYGDRGDNLLLLAKASPFMYIREKAPLPAILVAPLLNSNPGYSSFPEEYLDGVLAEVQASYPVDPRRIYLTGLSMGGEAAYRFAVHRPEAFAALAPLSAYVTTVTYNQLDRIKTMPVWAIHGDGDTVVPLSKGRQPVEALQELGSSIRFTILPDHDHDTWTDTYSDPAFYDWLFQYQRP